jgi:hypothetical protein
MKIIFFILSSCLASTAFSQKTEGKKVQPTDTTQSTSLAKIITQPPDVQPVYILDGKRIESIDKLNPENISSVEILKDSASVNLHGGRHYVVLITSKNNTKEKTPVTIRKREEEKDQ